MASIMKYTTPTTTACCMTTELTGLAAGSNATGSIITTGCRLYGDFEFLGGTLAALTGTGSGMAMCFVQALDDTNYQDGGTGLDPAPGAYVGFFPFQAAAACTVNRVVIRQLSLPATAFKPLLSNDTGAAMKTANELRYRLYTEEVV